jgi:hypothetical protein
MFFIEQRRGMHGQLFLTHVSRQSFCFLLQPQQLNLLNLVLSNTRIKPDLMPLAMPDDNHFHWQRRWQRRKKPVSCRGRLVPNHYTTHLEMGHQATPEVSVKPETGLN